MKENKLRNYIPIVDVGKLSLQNELQPDDRDFLRVGKEIVDALRHIGFFYLKGHGVPEGKIKYVMNAGAKFFDLPLEEKKKFPWNPESLQGYISTGREKLDETGHSYEVREAYEIKSMGGIFPDNLVPELKQASADFLELCKKLTNRLLIAMALGLDLDRSFFIDTHKEICSDNNGSSLRLLHYPPITPDVQKGAIRCGSHTDYGTITLLFQDDMGGLFVRDRKGHWVSADPIPGAILVNAGDILQFWTSEKLIATEHKVIIPEEEIKKRECRRSMAFFVQPDDPVLIQPNDSKSSLEPITAKEYILGRFQATVQN